MGRRPTLNELHEGVLAGDRTRLSQAITLCESQRNQDRALAADLLSRLEAHSSATLRIGISGPPGAGKSTFIDALGCRLVDQGQRVAVLAVDPSSRISGGSILGDKTRMAALVSREGAFIRPSPSGGSLGGVARRTRDAIQLCEAAGYTHILVETVGVGQSEVGVRDLVDVFLLLLSPAAGDDLQGIKRGVMEQADLIVVNKADGDTLQAARRTQADMALALHLGSAPAEGWTRQVLAMSAFSGQGLDAVWAQVQACAAFRSRGDGLPAWRREQEAQSFRPLVREALLEALLGQAGLDEKLNELEAGVASGALGLNAALQRLMASLPGLFPQS